MDMKKRLWIFIGAFIVAFVYWRAKVFFFVGDNDVPWFRAVTGLTVHHFHYGLIFISIASLLLIFVSVNWISVGLMGFGLGTTLDSFVSRMMSFSSVRAQEISTYQSSFPFTVIFFMNIVLLSFVFYFLSAGRK